MVAKTKNDSSERKIFILVQIEVIHQTFIGNLTDPNTGGTAVSKRGMGPAPQGGNLADKHVQGTRPLIDNNKTMVKVNVDMFNWNSHREHT